MPKRPLRCPARKDSGYQTLLLDVMQGDHTYFVRADETDAAWRLYTPLLQRRSPVHFHPTGSLGPAAADRLVRLSRHARTIG